MTATDNFKQALEFILFAEGVTGNSTGYVNSRFDRGGETNFGITHLSYDAYRRFKHLPTQSVKLMTRDEVFEIYHVNYWLSSGCDLLPSKLGLVHFDWCVNHGTFGAIRTLQKVVGVNDDGVIGAMTKQAITRAIANQGEKALCATYCVVRENYYRHIAANDRSQEANLEGWLNRLAALKKEIA